MKQAMNRMATWIAVVMMMMAMAIVTTACGGDDDDTPPNQNLPTIKTGTWVCIDTEAKALDVALTFYNNGNGVTAYFEGAWIDGTMTRTADKMKLEGRQLKMNNFKDFGTFRATMLPTSVTVTCDYELKGGKLIISNISMTPQLVNLQHNYALEYDKLYEGECFIF